MESANEIKSHDKKAFVLCFDGTGNKFEGKDTDSNILKIYRLLDRSAPNQFTFYNPGIGTYINTTHLEHTGVYDRLKSWYGKAKDSAIGTGLGDHVMSGYRFLMRYYSPEDDIYIFGFSRGAYTARFLAEMLDHIGLLSAGNDQLERFAWKCFSQWQARKGGQSESEKKASLDQYNFMTNFRETFSRPVRRIRFLGLFDTVNSVPRFEAAWMQRTKHPYTATSSAKVVRHAVSINERRAKFRQDLVSGSQPRKGEDDENRERPYTANAKLPNVNNGAVLRPTSSTTARDHSPVPSVTPKISVTAVDDQPLPSNESTNDPQHFLDASEHLQEPPKPLSQLDGTGNSPLTSEHHQDLNGPAQSSARDRQLSLAGPLPVTASMEDLNIAAQLPQNRRLRRRFSDFKRNQDILEVWFPGNHADIGGGWHTEGDEKWPLSHAPLVWMVQEAENAGLKFDPKKMSDLYCCPDQFDDYGIKVEEHTKSFRDALHQASTQGKIHDCLRIGGGLPRLSTISWKIMEYLPFRRMDLREDGSWHPIRWPLPGGEVRDIPADAKIHVSAIKRMQHDQKYRPGNLIMMGKGGRGTKIAPENAGIGEWEVHLNEGNPVSEIYVNKKTVGMHENKRRDTDATVTNLTNANGSPRERSEKEIRS